MSTVTTSPAASPVVPVPATKVAKPAKAVKTVVTETVKSTVKAVDLSKVRRGLKKKEAIAIVDSFKFPTTPFTLNEIFAATGIYHWYLVDYVKKNCRVVGDAPKAAGARGKAAKLYQLVTQVTTKG